ncbi:MAG: DUF72 domain-containing protein [Paucibacter sp.]|nr:DUF72 domain-containing protein [Roseateles sp.]
MQDELFESPAAVPAAALPAPAPRRRRAPGGVQPQPPEPGDIALAAALPPLLRLGGSTWSYPGWAGLVWDREYPAQRLSREGLPAYAQHPLLSAVCIDRSFYQPLGATEYGRYAAQVGEAFRFTIKAPSLVADAQIRNEEGRGREPNPAFLDPQLAAREFIEPALAGLGPKAGALVFQLSPLAPAQLARMDEQFERLDAMLAALPSPTALRKAAPDAVIAVEVRDTAWLQPRLVEILRRHGATYCLGLHPKLPAIDAQLWLLRALWPGPLVCRWNLHPTMGPYGYEEAERRYSPFDRLLDPDPATRRVLARVIRGTTGAGQCAFVTISNHAEGCAPLSIRELARELAG